MPKNIVICYDGTGNEFGDRNTNVVHAYESIIRNKEQVAFYDPGVGTFSYLGRKVGRRVGTILGQAFGLGLVENIEEGYEYLMSTHVPEDRIYIFGFSRGAFQARVLADYIHKIGILQKGSRNLIPYATKLYFNKDNETICDQFKATYCHPGEAYCLAVWDTVASLGYFFGRKFRNSILNPDVSFAYQAAAIDEMRKKFPIDLWDEDKSPDKQIMEQVWFVGAHSNVGGGYKQHGLSDLALIWMMEKAEFAGLRLRPGWSDGLEPDHGDTLRNSRAEELLWRLWSPVTRQIPEGAQIHDSVRRRMAEVEKYNPSLPTEFTWV